MEKAGYDRTAGGFVMERSTQARQEKATRGSAERLIRQICSKTRQRISAEDKIRIVLEGFRKEIPVSDLCRRESISTAI